MGHDPLGPPARLSARSGPNPPIRALRHDPLESGGRSGSAIGAIGACVGHRRGSARSARGAPGSRGRRPRCGR
ncbi:hypothetical protein DVS28_a4250 [Euzebya pacifica]|uniref:Uncharacterized protein n=1 Tax=Euzebya pacifica TaxID=1608957 RepID=A0A346Y369_9ACTN|nr:hypothetical protein DVS28_a4250 [Euzebya pacifica]